MTRDPITGASYTFDAENRISQVNGGAITYTYDAGGKRVEKNVNGVKTDYVYDLRGHSIAEINVSGVSRQELFFGDKHLGTYVNNTTYFSHGDWLGTERVRSDMTGAACETIQTLPYGDGQIISGACGDPSTRHFTGKERDPETGLDYFGARYYASAMGEFVSADWSATPVSVPYADLGDPQSLNLYSYVRNVPSTRLDRDGHLQQRRTREEEERDREEWEKEETEFNEFLVRTGQRELVRLEAEVKERQEQEVAKKKDEGFDDITGTCHAPVPGSSTTGVSVSNPNAPSAPPRAPEYVVSPGGDVIVIPKGASPASPVVNAQGKITGFAFTGGSGGNGLDPRVTTVRIMDATPARGSSPGYPNGYVVYQNAARQTVNPLTGRTISNSDPMAHLSLSAPKTTLLPHP